MLCASKEEEKAADGSMITNYAWKKWHVDFLGWYSNNNSGYYLNDEIYMAHVYVDEAKLYGAPLVHFSSDKITVLGTLYLDVNYSPIVVDFRKRGLSQEYAIGKADVSESDNTISAFMAEQLNSIDTGHDEAATDSDSLPEIKELVASKDDNTAVIAVGAVAAVIVFCFKKRKRNIS